MNFENISLLIIAGGKSSRIGQDKRFLTVGNRQMLEIILEKASKINFRQIFLCVEENSLAIKNLSDKFGANILIDEIKDAGAMSGIANGLKNIKTNWAIAVSADMPFFDFNVLKSINFADTQAIIPLVDGKFQPLAAFYHKNLANFFLNELLSGQRKIFNAIKKIPHSIAEISSFEQFFNVNTPADLRLACGRAENLSRKTPIIAIVAPNSGTGKTFFIEKLIKILSAQNISVGVIKSDSHSFNIDIEGKDSQKFQNAGAKSVAVVSPNAFFMIQHTKSANFLEIAEKMSADLILTESRTHETFPAISLWRDKGEVIKNEKIVAIFTSNPQKNNYIYQFDLNDIVSAEKIIKFLAGFTQCCKFPVRNSHSEFHGSNTQYHE